jgi:hypothetical protein
LAETPTWHEQYQRTRRWYERVSLASSVTDYVADDFYAFFVSCWHLKDWLKADLGVSSTIRGEVETFVNGNLWLRLCADLANGAKHLKLDQRARYDVQARVERTSILNTDFLMAPFPIATVLVVMLGGQPHDPRRVARSCMNAWNTFLADRGLAVDGGEYR